MLSLPDFNAKHLVICFAVEGQSLSFLNDNIIIKNNLKEIILQQTCHRIFSLWIIGSTTITSGVLERSKKFGFSVCLLSYGHRVYGIWNSPTEGNFVLRQKQYAYNKIDIAKHIVSNKIANQRQLLSSIRNKNSAAKEAIELLHSYKQSTSAAIELHTLLGYEGTASKLYFPLWFSNVEWKGRKPRTKIDPVNVVLDIGYTYLFNIIEAMLHLYGFDVYQGVYHKCFYQRKSLVCDLVEPFRPIVDAQIKKSLNLKQINPSDFTYHRGKYLLRIDKNKDYSRLLVGAILERKEDIFSYVQAYYRCFMRDKPAELFPVFEI